MRSISIVSSDRSSIFLFFWYSFKTWTMFSFSCSDTMSHIAISYGYRHTAALSESWYWVITSSRSFTLSSAAAVFSKNSFSPMQYKSVFFCSVCICPVLSACAPSSRFSFKSSVPVNAPIISIFSFQTALVSFPANAVRWFTNNSFIAPDSIKILSAYIAPGTVRLYFSPYISVISFSVKSLTPCGII